MKIGNVTALPSMCRYHLTSMSWTIVATPKRRSLVTKLTTIQPLVFSCTYKTTYMYGHILMLTIALSSVSSKHIAIHSIMYYMHMFPYSSLLFPLLHFRYAFLFHLFPSLLTHCCKTTIFTYWLLYLSTKGEPTTEQNTMKEIKHMSTSSLWVQQGKPSKYNSPHYENKKCNEYNHLQMARCVS